MPMSRVQTRLNLRPDMTRFASEHGRRCFLVTRTSRDTNKTLRSRRCICLEFVRGVEAEALQEMFSRYTLLQVAFGLWDIFPV